MAFATSILAGGYLENQDAGTINYKRVLAIRESVLSTTDLAHQITFDADFLSRWGFDSLEGMQAHHRDSQDRIALWARCKLLDLRRDFAAVPPAVYPAEKYYFSFYDTDWFKLDRNLLEVVVAWTERFHAINVKGVAGATIDTLLEDSRVVQFGLENALTNPAHQIKLAQSLIRLADENYENVPGAAAIIQDLKVDDVAQRMYSPNYITHLHMMGWYADGLASLSLADQRNAFNAYTQTDWGTEAVDAVQVEMQEMMARLFTIDGGKGGQTHELMLLQAELTAHGMIPEVLFQRIDFLPGEISEDVQGAVFVRFPGALALQSNAKTLACALEVFVPEGVTLTTLDVQLNQVDANALFTHYAVSGNEAIIDADTFTITDDLDAGIGRNHFQATKAAGWVGGVGGTLHVIGTFDLGYIDLVNPAFEIAPRPYQMFPAVNSLLNGASDVSSAFFFKGLRFLSGMENDGGRNYEFAQSPQLTS